MGPDPNLNFSHFKQICAIHLTLHNDLDLSLSFGVQYSTWPHVQRQINDLSHSYIWSEMS